MLSSGCISLGVFSEEKNKYKEKKRNSNKACTVLPQFLQKAINTVRNLVCVGIVGAMHLPSTSFQLPLPTVAIVRLLIGSLKVLKPLQDLTRIKQETAQAAPCKQSQHVNKRKAQSPPPQARVRFPVTRSLHTFRIIRHSGHVRPMCICVFVCVCVYVWGRKTLNLGVFALLGFSFNFGSGLVSRLILIPLPLLKERRRKYSAVAWVMWKALYGVLRIKCFFLLISITFLFCFCVKVLYDCCGMDVWSGMGWLVSCAHTWCGNIHKRHGECPSYLWEKIALVYRCFRVHGSGSGRSNWWIEIRSGYETLNDI